MVNLPYRLIGVVIYPAYGKIVLTKNMTKEECLEASKVYSDIRWIEPIQPKKKRK